MRPLKWLHLLAEAFSQIEDSKWFELHICGDWPLIGKLKNVQKNSKNKIILHWWIDNKSEKYVALLGKSMVYCLPSISENSPIGILEWMSSWCAVLTTATTWCLEMTEWFWFYADPEIESIKLQLEYLINTPHICEESWKKARIEAINNYDKNLIIKKYIDTYEKYL